MNKETDRVERDGVNIGVTTYKDYELVVMNNIAQLIDRGVAGSVLWSSLVDVLPGEYRAGLSQLQLQRVTLPGEAGGWTRN